MATWSVPTEYEPGQQTGDVPYLYIGSDGKTEVRFRTAGVVGQVLVSGGPGSEPSWDDPGSMGATGTNLALSGHLTVATYATIGTTLDVTGDTTLGALETTGIATLSAAIVSTDLQVSQDITAENLILTGDLSVGDDLTVTDRITVKDIVASGVLTVDGNVTLGNANSDIVTVNGALYPTGGYFPTMISVTGDTYALSSDKSDCTFILDATNDSATTVALPAANATVGNLQTYTFILAPAAGAGTNRAIKLEAATGDTIYGTTKADGGVHIESTAGPNHGVLQSASRTLGSSVKIIADGVSRWYIVNINNTTFATW